MRSQLKSRLSNFSSDVSYESQLWNPFPQSVGLQSVSEKIDKSKKIRQLHLRCRINTILTGRGTRSLESHEQTRPVLFVFSFFSDLNSYYNRAFLRSREHWRLYSYTTHRSLIGEGAFGYVFKGWIDEQTFTASKPGVGMVVAVKQLDLCVYEGHNEWLTEIRYLGQLRHPNLVKLIGFCSDGDNRLLVYEFMPRGSLEKHLFGRWVQSLSWATRIKVAIGVAKGLAFLHDAKSQIIYGDVQSSNILLDSDFNAKLSDFRLASAVPFEDVVHAMQYERGGLLMDELDMPFLPLTQVTEAFDTGHLYAKADVFGFGVVLLELLSGRRYLDKNKIGIEQNLVEWARLYLGDKEKLFRIMDFKLEGQFQKKVAHAMANLVLSCIDNEPKLRPCMSEVSAVLEKLQDP